jgi:ABC-type nitrate/sulfonate/bicarbonate transport system substrate-binding protein
MNFINNRSTVFVALILILAVAVVSAGCGTGKAKTSGADGSASSSGTASTPDSSGSAAKAAVTLPETLRVGFISANNSPTITGPEGWAQSKGDIASELQKYGVKEIKYLPFPNGPNLNEALASGSLDVGILGDTPAINARANGLATRLINIAQSGMNAWLITRADGPKSLAELNGQKVATAEGSYMSRYLNGLLKEQGLGKDVKVVHLLPPDGESALARGDIAAFAYPTGFGPLMIKKGYVSIDEAAKHPHLRGSSVTVAAESFLQDYPEFAKIWNGLKRKAVQEIRTKPDEYFELYAEASGYPLDVVKASFDIDQWPEEDFPAEGLQLLEETKAYLVAHGLAKKDFDLNDWIYK